MPRPRRAARRLCAGQLNKHLLFICQRQIKSLLGDWNWLFHSCTLDPPSPTLRRKPFVPLLCPVVRGDGREPSGMGTGGLAAPSSRTLQRGAAGEAKGKERSKRRGEGGKVPCVRARRAPAEWRHPQSRIGPCGAGRQALRLLVAEQFPHQQIFVVC